MIENQTTLRTRTAIHGGLITAAVLLGYFAFFGYPLLSENKSLKQDIEATSRQLASASTQLVQHRNELQHIDASIKERSPTAHHQFASTSLSAVVTDALPAKSPHASIVDALRSARLVPDSLTTRSEDEGLPSFRVEFQGEFSQMRTFIQQMETGFICSRLHGEADIFGNGKWSIELAQRPRRLIQ